MPAVAMAARIVLITESCSTSSKAALHQLTFLVSPLHLPFMLDISNKIAAGAMDRQSLARAGRNEWVDIENTVSNEAVLL